MEKTTTLVCGVGINDANYAVTSKVEGKQIRCPYYERWQHMIKRAYDPKLHLQYPTYKEVTIHKSWLVFSNFRAWMITQDWEDKELDKDILYPGNKHYSPSTCVFVEKDLNKLLNRSENSRGKHPQGVLLNKKTQKYQARISIHGKRKSLGYYTTAEEAHQVYIKAKIEYIKSFYGKVDKTIRNGLKRHVEKSLKE